MAKGQGKQTQTHIRQWHQCGFCLDSGVVVKAGRDGAKWMCEKCAGWPSGLWDKHVKIEKLNIQEH